MMNKNKNAEALSHKSKHNSFVRSFVRNKSLKRVPEYPADDHRGPMLSFGCDITIFPFFLFRFPRIKVYSVSSISVPRSVPNG